MLLQVASFAVDVSQDVDVVNLTRQYLCNAEFGFFGVTVPTRVQTARLNGLLVTVPTIFNAFQPIPSADDFDFFILLLRSFLINCAMAAIFISLSLCY
ncbi:unnamed protein product [Gongylonema pulchrum]|uniref:Transmembrane protein n=1 Tax=Gongylonema pulchrum TaxID=637853 RepID=A0A183F0F8_9BILA|nr:unnamed protein product [Gongylonema pulchrum]